MKKVWNVLSGTLAVLLTLAIVFGIGYYVGSLPAEEPEIVEDLSDAEFDLKLPAEVEKRIVTAEEVNLQLTKLAELATYSGEYTVSKSAEYTRYFLEDIAIPGTTNSISIECNGIVKVGYDVAEIEPQIDNESQTIYIALPNPSVLDNYIVWDSVRCKETNNILNPIDFEQYQMLMTEIETLGLSKVEDDGIYLEAEAQIKMIIQNFLSGFEEYEAQTIASP